MKRIEEKRIEGIRYKRTVNETEKNGAVVKSIISYEPSIPFNIDFDRGCRMKTVTNDKKIKKIIYIEKKMINFIFDDEDKKKEKIKQ